MTGWVDKDKASEGGSEQVEEREGVRKTEKDSGRQTDMHCHNTTATVTILVIVIVINSDNITLSTKTVMCWE